MFEADFKKLRRASVRRRIDIKSRGVLFPLIVSFALLLSALLLSVYQFYLSAAIVALFSVVIIMVIIFKGKRIKGVDQKLLQKSIKQLLVKHIVVRITNVPRGGIEELLPRFAKTVSSGKGWILLENEKALSSRRRRAKNEISRTDRIRNEILNLHLNIIALMEQASGINKSDTPFGEFLQAVREKIYIPDALIKPLGKFNNLRNRIVHEGYMPSPHDLEFSREIALNVATYLL